MRDEPAFPALEDTGTGTLGLQFRGLSILQYFAAHAPEPPQDFVYQDVSYIRSNGVRKIEDTRKESETERLIRWRWHYANLMCKEMK